MKVYNDKEFKSDVLGSKTPFLIDFYADWCGPCKMLGPVLEELSNDDDFKGKLHFGKVNTEEHPELAEQHMVQGIPCLIFFQHGKEVNRIVGFAPKPVMKAKIKSVLDGL
jgi:thioredoxin 1